MKKKKKIFNSFSNSLFAHITSILVQGVSEQTKLTINSEKVSIDS